MGINIIYSGLWSTMIDVLPAKQDLFLLYLRTTKMQVKNWKPWKLRNCEELCCWQTKKKKLKAKLLGSPIHIAYVSLRICAFLEEIYENVPVKKYNINNIRIYTTSRKFEDRNQRTILRYYKSVLAIIKKMKKKNRDLSLGYIISKKEILLE